MSVVLEGVGVALIVLGLLVTGVTVYGVVRMKGLYPRLQAASKASMLGAVAILAASVGTRDGATIARAVVVALFLLLTTPIAAHAIANAAYERDRAAGRPPEAEGETEVGEGAADAGEAPRTPGEDAAE